jgi:D-alanine-D-alanine ligase
VVCPAEIGADEKKNISRTALAAFRLLGCRGYARVDMRQDEAGQLNVIEVNPNPDVSPGSGALRQAEAAGMTYPQFVERIIKLALEKEDDDGHDTPDGKKGQASPDENTAGYARVQAG